MVQAAQKTLSKLLEMEPLCIAAGLMGGVQPYHKFGRNTVVGNAQEDIWDGGLTNFVEPTAARIHQLSSTSADDDGDPGAAAVVLEGLDDQYKLASERVPLDGLNNVPTTRPYRMIHRMYVPSGAVGSAGTNVGIIKATADVDLTVTAQINAGNGQTQMAVFQVPSNANAYMEAVGASLLQTSGAAKAAITLWAKATNGAGIWLVKYPFGLSNQGTSVFEKTYRTPRKFGPRTLLKVTGEASAANCDISAWFDLILADRPPF